MVLTSRLIVYCANVPVLPLICRDIPAVRRCRAGARNARAAESLLASAPEDRRENLPRQRNGRRERGHMRAEGDVECAREREEVALRCIYSVRPRHEVQLAEFCLRAWSRDAAPCASSSSIFAIPTAFRLLILQHSHGAHHDVATFCHVATSVVRTRRIPTCHPCYSYRKQQQQQRMRQNKPLYASASDNICRKAPKACCCRTGAGDGSREPATEAG